MLASDSTPSMIGSCCCSRLAWETWCLTSGWCLCGESEIRVCSVGGLSANWQLSSNLFSGFSSCKMLARWNYSLSQGSDWTSRACSWVVHRRLLVYFVLIYAGAGLGFRARLRWWPFSFLSPPWFSVLCNGNGCLIRTSLEELEEEPPFFQETSFYGRSLLSSRLCL